MTFVIYKYKKLKRSIMIFEVRYKGHKVNLDDIEVIYDDHFGEKFTGTIEDYGRCERNDAWAECEAGEDW